LVYHKEARDKDYAKLRPDFPHLKTHLI